MDANKRKIPVPHYKDAIRGAGRSIRSIQRTLERMQMHIDVQTEAIEKLATDSVKAGMHVFNEPFIPEYLGFIELKREEGDGSIFTYYIRPDFAILHRRPGVDGWFHNSTKLNISNMGVAINYFQAIGLEGVTMNDYIEGNLYVSKTPPWKEDIVNNWK